MLLTERCVKQLIHNHRKLFQIKMKIKIIKWQRLQPLKPIYTISTLRT